MPSDGQKITLTHTSPFDDSVDEGLLDTATSVAATIVYTSGPYSLTFYFPALRGIPSEPDIGGKGSRVLNQCVWEATRKAGASPADSPLLITLDDTV